MKRLALIGSWKRLGIQAGMLAGLGLAFAGTSETTPVANAGPMCPQEGDCSFKKPNILLVLDYSSSMLTEFAGSGDSRWNAAEDAVRNLVTAQNGFFNDNMRLAMMRFAHDQDVPNGASACPFDETIVDVNWYDAPNLDYKECTGDEIVDALDNTIDEPPDMACGTWTIRALEDAQSLIDQSRTDHPDDLAVGEERFYAVLLLTDGDWTGPDGIPGNQPPADDPVPVAGDLFSNDEVPVYVVALGDVAQQQFVDDIAAAGGTNQAFDAANPADLELAFETIVQDIRDSIIIPECEGGLPRIMIILDGSSSMLNVGMSAGAMGATGWDQAGEALAGANSIFDVTVNAGMNRVEDLVHLGLTVFGHNSPAEEKLLVQYGPCMKDNFAWALDPQTSCGPGGNCTFGSNDPWDGPPLTWDFKTSPPSTYNGAPPFVNTTRSHMPQCAAGATGCQGSGTYTHRGLDLVLNNLNAYKANPAPYELGMSTEFINILITDGNYTGYSNNAQVEGALNSLWGEGVKTFVIGFGDAIDNSADGNMENMACWGSGGSGILPCTEDATNNEDAFYATDQAALEDTLKTIIEGLAFDPCCEFNDCAMNPEPEPPETGTDTDTGTTGGTDTGTTDGGGTTTGTTDGGGTTTGTTDGGGTTTGTDDGGTTGTGTDDGGTTGTGTGTGTGTDGGDDGGTGTGTGGDDGDDGATDDGDDGGTGPGTGGFGTDDGDDGCGCSADSTPRGLLGSLALLGLAGFVRRRRR